MKSKAKGEGFTMISSFPTRQHSYMTMCTYVLRMADVTTSDRTFESPWALGSVQNMAVASFMGQPKGSLYTNATRTI